jgi:hypothetical protein
MIVETNWFFTPFCFIARLCLPQIVSLYTDEAVITVTRNRAASIRVPVESHWHRSWPKRPGFLIEAVQLGGVGQLSLLASRFSFWIFIVSDPIKPDSSATAKPNNFSKLPNVTRSQSHEHPEAAIGEGNLSWRGPPSSQARPQWCSRQPVDALDNLSDIRPADKHRICCPSVDDDFDEYATARSTDRTEFAARDAQQRPHDPTIIGSGGVCPSTERSSIREQ